MELTSKERKISPLTSVSEQMERLGDFPRWNALLEQVLSDRQKSPQKRGGADGKDRKK